MSKSSSPESSEVIYFRKTTKFGDIVDQYVKYKRGGKLLAIDKKDKIKLKLHLAIPENNYEVKRVQDDFH